MSLIYSPGPAAYDLGSGIGKAPAATMKGRYKDPDTSKSPGPGSYTLQGSTGTGLGYTLRPKTQLPVDLRDGPGPGAYNHDTDKGKGPKITMAPKLNLAGLTDANPGPGTYASHVEIGKEAPKYSMTSRPPHPSQGAYNLDAEMSKNRMAASMKSRHYDKADAFAPGPGAYKLSDSIGPGTSPSYTMRPKHSPKSASESVPGPGHYTLASTVGSAPAVSITARRNIKAPSESVPGPGAYSLEGHTGRDGAKYTLRPKTNLPVDLADSPGPGAYNHDTERGKGPKLTMSGKLPRAGFTDSVPGPGTYASHVEIGKDAPKYSMPGRAPHPSLVGARNPGPGAYNLDAEMSKNRMAASMKSRHYDKPDASQPGPGRTSNNTRCAYKLSDSIGGPGNSPSYTMRPKHSPKSASESVPGPGHYTLASTVGSAPAVSITARRNIKAPSESVPGPGHYKLEGHTGRDGAKYTLRMKTNLPADLRDSPGPGAYNHDTERGKGPKLTMSGKLPRAGFTDSVPGPGTYASPIEIGKDAPKYSMPGRAPHPSQVAAQNPGPGAYNLEIERVRHAVTMKSRHYDKPDAFQPGPGAYNGDAGQTIGSNAPKVSMHKKLGDYTYASSTNPPFLAQR